MPLVDFVKTKVEYLGYAVENGTVIPAPTTVKTAQCFPEHKLIRRK